MKLKIRAALLVLLALGATYTAIEAYGTLQPAGLDIPSEEMLSAIFDAREGAEYYLKNCDGCVAVYSGLGTRRPDRVTAIETSSLRLADKAMLERGIPVPDRERLLELLEDLGS